MRPATSTDRVAAEPGAIAPFFIVREIGAAVACYRDRLGFALVHASPEPEPFFAIVERGGARIFLKAIAPDVAPLPNAARHPWARCDAFVATPDPDALAAELAARGAAFGEPLKDHGDGLRGFAVADADGYVLFFGRPRG